MDFLEKSVCLSEFRRRFLPSTADYTHQWESCKRSQLELKYKDLTDSQYKVIQQLIKNGANIQLKDVFGRTPLSVAKETKDEKLVELLLGKEIDIDMKTNSGETLTSEAQFENNHD
ncbi:Hypothetical predicted protein [Mytilus galloprovincialis]|uniref:Uncharacterized protein n=1 Tax=Mytilus galloprovincialis TaxID=29158 RepID=A0A8B6GQ73_MYTGA|nr:Hypothetical predicted protein [Mytilus galloprovincialis]